MIDMCIRYTCNITCRVIEMAKGAAATQMLIREIEPEKVEEDLEHSVGCFPF